MSKNNINPTPIRITYKGIGMALGLILGGLVGFALGSPIIFAGGGMIVGLALGATLDQRN